MPIFFEKSARIVESVPLPSKGAREHRVDIRAHFREGEARRHDAHRRAGFRPVDHLIDHPGNTVEPGEIGARVGHIVYFVAVREERGDPRMRAAQLVYRIAVMAIGEPFDATFGTALEKAVTEPRREIEFLVVELVA